MYYCYISHQDTRLLSYENTLNLSHAGLKSMVVQGVKNPLVDLLSLEDKTLDEVGFNEMISHSYIILLNNHLLV